MKADHETCLKFNHLSLQRLDCWIGDPGEFHSHGFQWSLPSEWSVVGLASKWYSHVDLKMCNRGFWEVMEATHPIVVMQTWQNHWREHKTPLEYQSWWNTAAAVLKVFLKAEDWPRCLFMTKGRFLNLHQGFSIKERTLIVTLMRTPPMHAPMTVRRQEAWEAHPGSDKHREHLLSSGCSFQRGCGGTAMAMCQDSVGQKHPKRRQAAQGQFWEL